MKRKTINTRNSFANKQQIGHSFKQNSSGYIKIKSIEHFY